MTGENVATNISDHHLTQHDEKRSFSERLALLTLVSNELSKAKTLDELCRRAVEAGREQLGFDRVALFFVTADRSTMIGTYGTDTDGQTTDERSERHVIVAPSGLHTVVSGAAPLRLYKNAPVFRGDGQQVGVGDRIAVGLWNGETMIGFLSVDNFIHRRPFTDRDCELARLYAATVGHLCTLKRAQDELAQLAATLEQRVVERTAELEAANRELEAFSYSVSHDLRAPLRAMDGFSRILVEEFAQAMPPQAQTYLHRVRNNAQRMSELIEGLLALSRMGRQALQETYVDVQDMARQVIEELRVELGGREVEFVVDELPACCADATLLRQVFTNLISNALKFTRNQTTARIEVGCRPATNPSVYYVRDNGVGFDMRYADKLFGVFQRLHRAEDFEGTGIGLATVQRIIHRHGGRVWAEGEVGKGATFYFTVERSAA